MERRRHRYGYYNPGYRKIQRKNQYSSLSLSVKKSVQRKSNQDCHSAVFPDDLEDSFQQGVLHNFVPDLSHASGSCLLDFNSEQRVQVTGTAKTFNILKADRYMNPAFCTNSATADNPRVFPRNYSHHKCRESAHKKMKELHMTDCGLGQALSYSGTEDLDAISEKLYRELSPEDQKVPGDVKLNDSNKASPDELCKQLFLDWDGVASPKQTQPKINCSTRNAVLKNAEDPSPKHTESSLVSDVWLTAERSSKISPLLPKEDASSETIRNSDRQNWVTTRDREMVKSRRQTGQCVDQELFKDSCNNGESHQIQEKDLTTHEHTTSQPGQTEQVSNSQNTCGSRMPNSEQSQFNADNKCRVSSYKGENLCKISDVPVQKSSENGGECVDHNCRISSYKNENLLEITDASVQKSSENRESSDGSCLTFRNPFENLRGLDGRKVENDQGEDNSEDSEFIPPSQSKMTHVNFSLRNQGDSKILAAKVTSVNCKQQNADDNSCSEIPDTVFCRDKMKTEKCQSSQSPLSSKALSLKVLWKESKPGCMDERNLLHSDEIEMKELDMDSELDIIPPSQTASSSLNKKWSDKVLPSNKQQTRKALSKLETESTPGSRLETSDDLIVTNRPCNDMTDEALKDSNYGKDKGFISIGKDSNGKDNVISNMNCGDDASLGFSNHGASDCDNNIDNDNNNTTVIGNCVHNKDPCDKYTTVQKNGYGKDKCCEDTMNETGGYMKDSCGKDFPDTEDNCNMIGPSQEETPSKPFKLYVKTNKQSRQGDICCVQDVTGRKRTPGHCNINPICEAEPLNKSKNKCEGNNKVCGKAVSMYPSRTQYGKGLSADQIDSDTTGNDYRTRSKVNVKKGSVVKGFRETTRTEKKKISGRNMNIRKPTVKCNSNDGCNSGTVSVDEEFVSPSPDSDRNSQFNPLPEISRFLTSED